MTEGQKNTEPSAPVPLQRRRRARRARAVARTLRGPARATELEMLTPHEEK